MRPSDLAKSSAENVALDWMAWHVATEQAGAELTGADLARLLTFLTTRMM